MQLEKGQAFKSGSVHDPVDWVPICKAFRHAVNELADFMSYRIQFFYPNAYLDVMTTLTKAYKTQEVNSMLLCARSKHTLYSFSTQIEKDIKLEMEQYDKK